MVMMSTSLKNNDEFPTEKAEGEIRSSGGPRKRQRLPPPSLMMKMMNADDASTKAEDLFFCTVITESTDDASSATSNSTTSGSSTSAEALNDGLSNNGSSSNQTASSLATKNTPSPDASWQDQLLKFSNWASLLCVLDCTILPLCTMLLPLLGIVARENTAEQQHQQDWLHELGHTMALYFVVPVGTMALIMNYLGASARAHSGKNNNNNKAFWIAAMGFLGLFLVLVANSGGSCHDHNGDHDHDHDHDHKEHHHHDHDEHHHHHHHEQEHDYDHHHQDDSHTSEGHDEFAALLAMIPSFLKLVQQAGMIHRVTNLTGCFLMMTSNYLAKRNNNAAAPQNSSDNENNTNSKNDDDQRQGACWDPSCFCFSGYASSGNWQRLAWKNKMMGL